MKEIADIMGYTITEKEPTIAVLRCQGSCQNAPIKFEFTGLKSCRLAAQIATARSECPYGCMRLGDCVKACKFGALSINKETGLPQVDENKCVGCLECVKHFSGGCFMKKVLRTTIFILRKFSILNATKSLQYLMNKLKEQKWKLMQK